MLALTPAPLETDGERAFFAELARWDSGGAVRAAVVASLPRTDDGPLRRRLADAVLFLPEGLAVVRVVEVERQSGVVTASPEGAWTIGPGGRPGEVLQMTGGGSSPLDGLMRAGMDTAVRLRRAGLEPGRIARLAVLVGGVTGLVPEDGDLGEGDQVATLDTRSLLLGIARAARHAGEDGARLWTTADVRAALEALGLPGRGPSVEELNGEGLPYSPYVLRRSEVEVPAGVAVAAAVVPPPLLAPPAAGPPDAPARPRPPVPPVQPLPAARPVPPARPGTPPLQRSLPPVPPRSAPEGSAPRPTRDTAAVDPRPAGLPGAHDTVAVDPPAAAPIEDTGGIGGLFAGAPSEDPAPPTGPSAVPPARPPGPPMPPLALPRTGVLPAVPPPADAGPPYDEPGYAPDGHAADGESADGPARGARRTLLLVLGAVALVVLAVVATVSLLGGGPGDAAAGPAGAGSPASGTPAAGEPAGPRTGDTADVGGRTFTARAVDVAAGCEGHAYGRVAEYLAAEDCTGLARALWATELDGRAVVVAVARVRMPDTAAARRLQSLTDTSGTGNVSDLLREGVRYPGGPEGLSGAEYASAVAGPVVTVVEAAWVRPGDGSAAEVDAVATDALGLGTPPLP